MSKNPAMRIRGIHLIEKMKSDPAYAAQLTLKNTSMFLGTRLTELNEETEMNTNRRETEYEKDVQSIDCTGLNDHTHGLQRR